jgi:hypothetical protein
VTNKELIEKLKHIVSLPTIYYSKSGGDWSSWNGSSWNFDCVCLIKSVVFWNWKEDKTKPHGGANYNSKTDYSCDGLLNACSDISSDFKNITPGELVCMYGKSHVGIYIGNGQVIEATSKWDGKVQISNIGTDGKRSKSGSISFSYWTKHGKLPNVEYLPIETQTSEIKPSNDTTMTIIQTQMQLKHLGYYNGAIDGSFGALSKKATQSFQKDYGLQVDGDFGKYTTAKSIEVWKNIQTKLKTLGYYQGIIDGLVGNYTLSAIKEFQSKNKLLIDGICGKYTRKKLGI